MAALVSHLGVASPSTSTRARDALDDYLSKRNLGQVAMTGPTHNMLTLTADPVTASWLRADLSNLHQQLADACEPEPLTIVRVYTKSRRS